MQRKSLVLLLPLLLAAGLAAAIYAYVRNDRGRPDAGAGPEAGASAAMVGAMDRMHEAMGRTAMTGDIDRDFVALMVPHHQSALEMAQVYLRHGRDPELRRLAENIVASQEAEIRQMRGRVPAPAPAASPAPAAEHDGH